MTRSRSGLAHSLIQKEESIPLLLKGKRSSFFIWIISFPNNGLFKYPVRDL